MPEPMRHTKPIDRTSCRRVHDRTVCRMSEVYTKTKTKTRHSSVYSTGLVFVGASHTGNSRAEDLCLPPSHIQKAGVIPDQRFEVLTGFSPLLGRLESIACARAGATPLSKQNLCRVSNVAAQHSASKRCFDKTGILPPKSVRSFTGLQTCLHCWMLDAPMHLQATGQYASLPMKTQRLLSTPNHVMCWLICAKPRSIKKWHCEILNPQP